MGDRNDLCCQPEYLLSKENMNLEIRRDSMYWHVKRNDLKEIISSLQSEGNYWEGQVFLTKRKKEYKLSFRICLNSNDEDELEITDGQFTL